MSFSEVDEDIFESAMQTIVVPVNVVGAMGKGLALAFRKRFPGLYGFYRKKVFKGKLGMHDLIVYPLEDGRQILLFPSKIHWRDPSNRDHVVGNLEKLARNFQDLGITSLAIPPVGCGLGQLEYEKDIREAMVRCFEHLPIEVRCVFGKK